MNHGWKYRGANVVVPFTADIAPQFKFDGKRSDVIQRVLNGIKPWMSGEEPIETMEFRHTWFYADVVPLEGKRPIWVTHAGHRAKKPGPSPFVQLLDDTPRPRTNVFTIELVQTPRRPKLVRAYPGEYTPPLPWMASARDAEGGIAACLEFWNSHAYVFRRALVAARQTEPNWFSSQ